MQTESGKKEFALRFIFDRIDRTLRYAQSRKTVNRPDIITPLKQALSAVSAARGVDAE